HRPRATVHRDFREAEEGLEDGRGGADVAGADHEALEPERGRRRLDLIARGGELHEHAGARLWMEKGDVSRQPGPGAGVEELDLAILELAQRVLDVRGLEAEMMEAFAAPGQEPSDPVGGIQRLEQLDLALAGGEQRGPHAL